jgi:poly-gamma-glutamate synthesis protein (capsule biosynthesis protein)
LGAGRTIDAASSPFIYGGVRVFGIGSFPRERSGWDGASVAVSAEKSGILFASRGGSEKLKAALAAQGSLNVVLFHGGNEWASQPDGGTRRVYTELAEAGADLLIGSHPHVTQGFEWIAGKPVFWSLGNFVFAGMDNTAGGEEGLLVKLGFYGKTLVYLEPHALALKQARTDLAPQEKLAAFYRLSQQLSARTP